MCLSFIWMSFNCTSGYSNFNKTFGRLRFSDTLQFISDMSPLLKVKKKPFSRHSTFIFNKEQQQNNKTNDEMLHPRPTHGIGHLDATESNNMYLYHIAHRQAFDRQNQKYVYRTIQRYNLQNHSHSNSNSIQWTSILFALVICSFRFESFNFIFIFWFFFLLLTVDFAAETENGERERERKKSDNSEPQTELR